MNRVGDQFRLYVLYIKLTAYAANERYVTLVPLSTKDF